MTPPSLRPNPRFRSYPGELKLGRITIHIVVGGAKRAVKETCSSLLGSFPTAPPTPLFLAPFQWLPHSLAQNSHSGPTNVALLREALPMRRGWGRGGVGGVGGKEQSAACGRRLGSAGGAARCGACGLWPGRSVEGQ